MSGEGLLELGDELGQQQVIESFNVSRVAWCWKQWAAASVSG